MSLMVVKSLSNHSHLASETFMRGSKIHITVISSLFLSLYKYIDLINIL